MSPPHAMSADEQRLAVGKIVTLYKIDATAINGGVLRYTPGDAGGDPVSFGASAYTPLPIKMSGLKYDGSGPPPRPSLTVGAANNTIILALLRVDNLRGAAVTRIRTLERYLDGQPGADGNKHWPKEIYLVEGLASRTRREVSWTLASPLDYDRVKLPGRQILRDVCAWEYRQWDGAQWNYAQATCPYTGGNFFNASDEAVNTAAEDKCSRRLSGCRKRFPATDLPFGGFVGAGRLRR